MYNNIIANQNVGVYVDPGMSQNLATIDGVLWWNNGSNVIGNHLAFNETSGDPRFTDVPNRDYHIQAGSAAIDAANSTYTVPQDVDHEPRWGAPDLGADEYWAPGALKQVYLPLVIRWMGFVNDPRLSNPAIKKRRSAFRRIEQCRPDSSKGVTSSH